MNRLDLHEAATAVSAAAITYDESCSMLDAAIGGTGERRDLEQLTEDTAKYIGELRERLRAMETEQTRAAVNAMAVILANSAYSEEDRAHAMENGVALLAGVEKDPLSRAGEALVALRIAERPQKERYLRSRGWAPNQYGNWDQKEKKYIGCTLAGAMDIQSKEDAAPIRFILDRK